MFTGIIQDIGTIRNVEPLGGGRRYTVASSLLAPRLAVNDSVAINGVCQTVVAKSGEMFEVVAVEETLRKTTFGQLHGGQLVNLELPLRLNDLLGGHLLLGHVDTVGTVIGITPEQTGTDYVIGLSQEFLRYVVFTGSIAVDGVSLTVAELRPDAFRVAIIPHTMEKTIFRTHNVGQPVNIEVDIIGKYIERLMAEKEGDKRKKPFLSVQELKDRGY